MTVADLFAKLSLKIDQSSFVAADKLITAVKTAVVALVSVKAAQWINGLVQETTRLGGSLNDLSESVSVPVERLQELGFAAQLNGSSIGAMGNALRRLSMNMLSAAKNGGEQADTFKGLGIAIKNSDGTLRAADEVLRDFSDRLAAMPKGAEQTALAVKVLGRAGVGLIPTLKGGSSGLDAMAKEARDLNIILSEDAVKALDDFGDEQDKVKAAMAGFRNEAVVALLPTLQDLIKRFKEWIKAHRVDIIDKLKFAVRLLINVLITFGRAVDIAVTAVKWLAENWAALMPILGGLTAMMLIYRAAAIKAAAAQLAAFAPFIGMALLVTAFILVLEDFYIWMEGGESVIGRFVGNAQDALGPFFDVLLGGFYSIIQRGKAFFSALRMLFSGDILGFLKKIGGMILHELTRPWRLIISIFRTTAKLFKGIFQAVFDWFAGKLDWIIDKVMWVGQKIFGMLESLGSGNVGGMVKQFAAQEKAKRDAFNVSHEIPAARAHEAWMRETTNAQRMEAQVNITLPPGSDTKEVATSVHDTIKRLWDDQMRQAYVASEGT